MDNILCNGFCDVSQEEMMEINGKTNNAEINKRPLKSYELECTME